MRFRILIVTALLLSNAYAVDFTVPDSVLNDIKNSSSYKEATSTGAVSGVKVSTCPSSPNFLRVKVIDRADGNKDIKIEIDRNFDGVTDFLKTFTGISAVCTGEKLCPPGMVYNPGTGSCEDSTGSSVDDGYGFIKCTGIFPSGCSYYPVDFAGGNFNVGAAAPYRKGCLCIQDSCGVSGDSVLQTVGGFFAGMYAKNAGIEIDNGTLNPVSREILYKATNTSCESEVNTLKSYYGNPSAMESAKNDVVSGSKTVDVGGMDAWTEFAAPASSKAPGNYTCEIKTDTKVTTLVKTDTCPSGITRTIGGQLYCLVGKSGSYEITNKDGATYSPGIITLKGLQNIYAVIVNDESFSYLFGKGIIVYKDGVLVGKFIDEGEGLVPSGWFFGRIVYENPNMNDDVGKFLFKFFASASTLKAHLEVYKKMEYQTAELSLTYSTSCSPPSGCKLESEEYCDWTGGGCFETVKNGMPLEVSSTPSCKDVSLPTGENWHICATGTSVHGTSSFGNAVSVAAPWWIVRRTYSCPPPSASTPPELDFSYDNSTGTLSSPIETFSVSGNMTDCIKYCKVRKVEEEKEGTSDSAKEITTVEIRKCNGSICPASAGETVVESCTCSLGMDSDSLAILKALDESTKDVICSSEAP